LFFRSHFDRPDSNFYYDKTKKIGKAPPFALQLAARIDGRIRKQRKGSVKSLNIKIGDENQLVKFFVQKLNTGFPPQIIENFI